MLKVPTHSIISEALISTQFTGVSLFQNLIGENRLEEFIKKCGCLRRRVFPPDVTLLAFLSQLISNGSCQHAVAQVLAHRIAKGNKAISTKTSSYSRAREKLSLEAIVQLTKHIASDLESSAPKKWLWNNREVLMMDGSTLGLVDSPENQKEFPQSHKQKEGLGFPLARLVALTSLSTGAVVDFEMGAFKGKGTGEVSLGRKIIKERLKGGEVIVGDALYFNYFNFSEILKVGADLMTRKHSRDIRILDSKRINKNDILLLVKKPRPSLYGLIDEETYEKAPNAIWLRQTTIVLTKPGFRDKIITIVSTLLDYLKYSSEEIGQLYELRWNIELDFRSIKKIVGMDSLRCKTPEMAKKEAWVYLLAYNLIRKMIAEAAILTDKDPRKISFKGAVTMYSNFKDILFSTTNKSTWSMYYFEMLRGIAAQEVGKRPGRFEPRARKKRPDKNDFPALQIKRNVWKLMTILPHLGLIYSDTFSMAFTKMQEFMPNTRYS